MLDYLTSRLELQVGDEAGAVPQEDSLLEPERVDLPEDLLAPRTRRDAAASRLLAEVEREHILAVLAACGGSQAEAARVLGIARNTLWRKLRAFGGS